MTNYPEPLDLKPLKVYPLAERKSMTRVADVLVEPSDVAPECDAATLAQIKACAEQMKAARKRNASVMVIYGAHLIKNGGQLLLNQLMDRGMITHLATNGAGTIHDWEFSSNGASTESVRDNVAKGSFGTWDETGRYIQYALLTGGVRGEGYGRSLGRMIQEDGVMLPTAESLLKLLLDEPEHPLAPARADLLLAIRAHALPSGWQIILHPWRNASVLGHAFRDNIPFTVHPGIGYDIITNHPMYNGAVVGRAAGIDFRLFCTSVANLEGGVVISIGSAIMGPQVFEKSVSCVNNLRLQAGKPVLKDFSIHVVDLQDGGHWDWTQGEPPKDTPAYYLRFCKSYSRMGGAMSYHQCDNIAFLHQLFHTLS